MIKIFRRRWGGGGAGVVDRVGVVAVKWVSGGH